MQVIPIPAGQPLNQRLASIAGTRLGPLAMPEKRGEARGHGGTAKRSTTPLRRGVYDLEED